MAEMESVDHLFTGKAPELRALYDQLIAALQTVGEVRVAPKQTSIHLEKNSGFAGVHPRKDYFNLEFRTADKIDHPRIKRTQQLSAKRFEHTVKIASPEDVDDLLIGWLKDAYALSK